MSEHYFNCVSCSRELPTTEKKYWQEGSKMTGGSHVDLKVFNTESDGYFFRINNPDALEVVYEEHIQELEEESKTELRSDVQETIDEARQEYREIVENKKIEEIESEFQERRERFRERLNPMGQPFEEQSANKRDTPYFGIDPICAEELSDNVVSKEIGPCKRYEIDNEQFFDLLTHLQERLDGQGWTPNENVVVDLAPFSRYPVQDETMQDQIRN